MKNKFEVFYYLIPFFIVLIQALYTFSSYQIRLEEVIESFRSTWWFQNRLVWNGSYSFLGWSLLQNIYFSLFGFDFYAGRYIKLAIKLLAFILLAIILKRYLGTKKATVPLLTIGLSPTFIYFNSLQLSLGTDFNFFVICFYLLTKINIKKIFTLVFFQPLVWFIAMIAWLSYPGFLFYLPLLFASNLFFLQKQIKTSFYPYLKYGFISVIAFVIPVILMYFYIENRELLVLDPVLKRGLFRSYGSFELNSAVFFDNLKIFISDFFIEGRSHYFELKKVEFSDIYPIFSLLAVFIGSFFIRRKALLIFKKDKKLKKIILFIWVMFLLYLFTILFVGPQTLGGIRRGTVLILLFYFLFTIVWGFFLSSKRINKIFKRVVLGGCIILLIHHILVFPINLQAAKDPSIFQERWYFNQERPDLNLSDLVNKLTKTDVTLVCNMTAREQFLCPGLSLIYPAVANNCYWDKLPCKNMILYLPETKEFKKLDIKLWGTKPHTEP